MERQDIAIIKRCVNGILSNFDYERKELESGWLKELKSLVRKAPSVIEDLVFKLFEEFNKSNPDRRLGTMLICDYFFQRSHQFRCNIVTHLQDLMLFTIETDPLHYPLPEPAAGAVCLKRESLKIIKAWIDKFGPGYPKLDVALKFLNNCKHFDFKNSDERPLVERQRIEAEQKRKLAEAQKIGKLVRSSFDQKKALIDKGLSNCRQSLLSLFPNVFVNKSNQNLPVQNFDEERHRLHGYKPNERIVISIDSNKIDIHETQQNAGEIRIVEDAQPFFKSNIKLIKEWLKKLKDIGTNENEALISELQNYQAQMEHELDRCQKLKIKHARNESDSDFEDVLDEDVELGFEPINMFEMEAADNLQNNTHQVQKRCNAPLLNGNLCTRMDVEVCPFHGPIIERDKDGVPLEDLNKSPFEKLKTLEQQEREYWEALKAAGISPTKRRRRMNKNSAYGTGRKREKPEAQLEREQLSKKLFNPRTIKRVTETLTQIQQQRAQFKVSNQFKI